MPRFLAEPGPNHRQAPQIGILLINLGTPEAPTPAAVKAYLREFLSDPRVVEIPRLVWAPILHGIILNTRPKASAAKYATVWSKDGSPLRVHTERQARLLQGYFSNAGHTHVHVLPAMRYGAPGITSSIEQLKAKGCTRILALPLYPQYAASTTASAVDALGATFARLRNQPELRIVRSFADHPGYIRALAASIEAHWQKNGRGELLVMSFHGIPRASLDRGDPYHCECHKTARLLAEALRLQKDQYRVTFQSRFGRAEWLKPYTQPSLENLAREGRKQLDIVCPGFVSDCLETLEEIALECRAAFLAAGGKELRYISCLNENHDFIHALMSLSQRHIQDWLAEPQLTTGEIEARANRALDAGARA